MTLSDFQTSSAKSYATLPLETPRSSVFSDRLASVDIPWEDGLSYPSPHLLVVAAGIVLARYNETERVDLGICRSSMAAHLSLAISPKDSLAQCVTRMELTLPNVEVEPRTFSDQVAAGGRGDVVNRNPLFGLMVALDSTPPPALRQDASIYLDGSASRLAAQYNARLFRPEVVERYLTHVGTVLKAIGQTPDLGVGELIYMGEEEASRLANLASGGDPASCTTLFNLLETALACGGDEIVLEYQGGSWSLAELVRRADTMAAALGNRIGSCARIGIALRPGADQIAALLAAIRTGAVLVPLDTTLPPNRLDAITSDACLSSVITTSDLAHRFVRYPQLLVDEVLEDPEPAAPSPPTDPDQPLYLMFTSGSTGRAKGVLVPNRTLANLICWEDRQRPAAGKRTLGRTSIAFDVGLQEIFATILFGGILVLASDEERADVSALGGLLAERRISRVYLPPVALYQLAESANGNLPGLSLLEHVIVAGERLLISQAVRRFFRSNNARLINQYGPTETHVATEEVLEPTPLRWPEAPSIGRPIAGVETHVLDSEGRSVPILVEGELHVGGIAPALGYVSKPSDEDDAPGTMPLTGVREGCYRTGDRARWRSDGRLEFLGRLDDQVKVRGYRVELGDLETNAASIPLVRQVAARHWAGEEWTGLALYVVLEADSVVSPRAIRDALRQRVPEYMLPPLQAIRILLELPLTPSGKVDRLRLPPPAPLDVADDEAVDVSARLRAIWARRLGLAVVNAEENFLDIGGHSLLAIQLISEVNDAFQVAVPLSTLLRGATLEQLIETVSQLLAKRADPSDISTGPPALSLESSLAPHRILPVTIGGRTLAAKSPAEAMHLWKEIFEQRAYAPPQIQYREGFTIVDVGANIGLFTWFAIQESGGCRVLAVEPAAEAFACLERNFEGASNVVCVRAGCGACDAEAASLSYFPDAPAMSSFAPDGGKDAALLKALLVNDPVWQAAGDREQQSRFVAQAFVTREERPPMRRLSTLIRGHGLTAIDLLKIDVQRGEDGVVAGIEPDHWPIIQQVVIEMQDYEGSTARMKQLLEDRGFLSEVVTIPLHEATQVRFVYARRA